MAIIIKKPHAAGLAVAKNSVSTHPASTIRFVTRPAGAKAKPAAAAKPTATRPLVVPAANGDEKRAERAEKLRDYLLSSVASDVRRPLEDIASTLQALREGAGTEEERAAAIDWAATASLALVQLLDDLIDISEADHADESSRARVSIAAVVSDVVAAYSSEANAKGLAISGDVPQDIPDLEVDGPRLAHVLRRLVDSAVKFTAAGRIGVGAAYSVDELTLYVEDTGCGMPAEAQSKFAEMTGFGDDAGGYMGTELSIVKRLVSSLGGEIALSSTPGIGTVFTITLKGVKAFDDGHHRDLASMQRISYSKLGRLGRPGRLERPLVCDRSPVQRAVVGEMLKALGTTASTVADGQEALVKVVTGACDIVFTDLELDGTMGGRDLVREIRKIPTLAKLPVFALTADESVRAEAAALGFDGVILKPVTSSKLRRAIEG